VKGIVVIHGVGAARQSDTLIDMGQPLFAWVAIWAREKGLRVRFEDAGLAFSQLDDGTPRDPPHATLAVSDAAGHPQLTWVMAEAWWSLSVRQPPVATIVWWAMLQAFRLLPEFVQVAHGRVRRAMHYEHGMTHPNPLIRGINCVNALAVLLIGLIGMLAPAPLLVLLALVAQILIKPIQDVVVVRMLNQFLVFNVAQFRTILEDEVQAANMRERFESAMRWLVEERGCDELYGGGVRVTLADSRPRARGPGAETLHAGRRPQQGLASWLRSGSPSRSHPPQGVVG
jgi:hypothetical protein